jgi:hypothetical protein
MDKNTKDNKVVDFSKAERNARKRDFEVDNQKFQEDHNGIDQETFEMAMSILSKATGKDIGIYTKRSPQSKVRFAQFLQKNWEYLREQKYLTNEEKLFLVDIQPNVSMHSNAIVDDIMKRPPDALNVQGVANIRNAHRTTTSKIINSLIKKGLIAKSVSGDFKDINQAKDYVLFVNPNIIYVGDRDDVEEHLILMFKNQMKNNSILKNLPQKLF